MDAILSLPFALAVAILFCIVLLRTNATYWAGRGAAAGLAHSRRLSARLARPRPAWALARAGRLIERWGPIAVVLAYLTVGLQTAIHLAAGSARMSLKHYLPAAVVGSAAWAFLYATIGLAAIELWVDSALASPWLWLVAGAAVLAAVVRVLLVRRLRRPRDTVDEAAQSRAGHERSGT
ncbi:DedA family protein [Sinomonas mesophila]|uniref:DedA family protein n=1 Tax=Sinomonas mesophila TaxID=1531955 RepID=UPI000984A73F|nr:VTT domain-containing protein [Sinomonas mesophila]